MFLGARGSGGGQFLAHFGAKRPSKVKNKDKSLKSKVMAFFGPPDPLKPLFLGGGGLSCDLYRPEKP